MRKTSCPHGHAYDRRNTIWEQGSSGKPYQRCRRCKNQKHRRRYDKKNLKEIAKGIRRRKRMDLFDDIKQFHERFGLVYAGPPRELPEDLHVFRSGFMAEELAEYLSNEKIDHDTLVNFAKCIAACEDQTLEKRLDALVDLVYVALGTAYLHGFDFNEAWRRVHLANMKKVRSEREGDGSQRGGEFDVIKPPGWTAPDLSDLVQGG